MITWRPDTESPTQRTTALLCSSIQLTFDIEDLAFLKAELFTWTEKAGWRGEVSGEPPNRRFWWCPEEEILAKPLRNAARSRNFGERVVLPLVMAFAFGVLAMDVAHDITRPLEYELAADSTAACISLTENGHD